MNEKLYVYLFNCLKETSYEKQDHWDIFDNIYYQKIKQMNNLQNFRNNGISNMLETGLPSQERFQLLEEKKNYNTEYNADEKVDIVARFNELKKMLGKDIYKIIFNNNIGNPRCYKYQNFLLNFDDLYHVYATWQLYRFISILKKDIKKVVEIGGGYGNFAHKFKNLYKNCKYIIIDLPEVLLLQHYYLSLMNPAYNIINLLDKSVDIDINEDKYDFLLIPSNLYKNFNFSFDIIINKRSLGEMPKKIMNDYFVWVQKNLKKGGLFYIVNRYAFTKSNDKNKIREYNFDEKWDILLSKPQWLQTHLHEFLLQRRDNESSIPLNFILKSFPLSTPPPGPIMKDSILKQSDWMKYQNIT